MASIFITYGLLGFPFLFGLIYNSPSGIGRTYWEWVSLGFTISLSIFVLRYIRVAVKWKETKQYILKKLGKGGDPGANNSLESRADFYYKGILFFPAWFMNYIIFPQSTTNLLISYIICTFFLIYCTYYSAYYFLKNKHPDTDEGKKSRNAEAILTAGATGAVALVVSGFVSYSLK